MKSARSTASRPTVRLLALLVALSAARPAHALADDTPKHLRIARAPLEHVLLEIARLSGQHVVFASSLVKDRWAGPIDGTLSAQDAARRALQGVRPCAGDPARWHADRRGSPPRSSAGGDRHTPAFRGTRRCRQRLCGALY